jgi:predicted small metal-binding protein
MKTLKCRDAGFDCDGVIYAYDDQEVLNQASIHASEVHGVTVTPELAAKIKPLIKEVGSET